LRLRKKILGEFVRWQHIGTNCTPHLE